MTEPPLKLLRNDTAFMFLYMYRYGVCCPRSQTGGNWEGYFRVSPGQDWITFGRYFSAANALNGVLVNSDLAAGLFVMQDEASLNMLLLQNHTVIH